MGFFSWITSDTGQSICNLYSSRKPFKVYMITENRQVFEEPQYEGYGKFGGQDIHELIGELNGLSGENIRERVFDELFLRGVKNGEKTLTYKKDFDHYESPIESEGGLTPNQLVSEKGWESFGNDISFPTLSERLKLPKLVRFLPKEWHLMTNEEWKAYFNRLSYPKDCEDQGYFYDEDED